MCDRLQFILKIGQAHFWELRGGGNEKNNNYSQGGRWNVQTFSRTVLTNSNIYELLQNLPNTCVWLISQFLKRPYLLAKKTPYFLQARVPVVTI